MDGVHTQGLHSGQQDGGQDNDGGAGIHDHAQDQEQDDQDRQDAPGSGEVAHNEVLDHLGGAGQGQHAAESGGESQHEGQAAVSLDRAGQEGDQVLQGDGAVHHQGDEQRVEHGHAGSLSGGDDAGVDAAWPLFGSANQLLSALVILTLCVFLKVTGRSNKMLFPPLIIMLCVTFTALVQRTIAMVKAIKLAASVTIPAGQTSWGSVFIANGLQLIIAILLIVLGVIIVVNSVKSYAKSEKNSEKTAA